MSNEHANIAKWQVLGELLKIDLTEKEVRAHAPWLHLFGTLGETPSWNDLRAKWHQTDPPDYYKFDATVSHVQATLEAAHLHQQELMRDYHHTVHQYPYMPLFQWQKAITLASQLSTTPSGQEHEATKEPKDKELKEWYSQRRNQDRRLPIFEDFITHLQFIKVAFEKIDKKVDQLALHFTHVLKRYRDGKKQYYQQGQNAKLQAEVEEVLEQVAPLLEQYPELINALDGWMEIRFWMNAPQWEGWDKLEKVMHCIPNDQLVGFDLLSDTAQSVIKSYSSQTPTTLEGASRC